jgi:ribosome-associated protein
MKDIKNSKDLVRYIAKIALNKKGTNITVIDLKRISTMVDYFVIITGTSDVHAKAISDGIVMKLRENGIRKWHIEGYSYGHWILLDYVDVVVHILLEDERLYYNIELLWGDAPIEKIEKEDDKS